MFLGTRRIWWIAAGVLILLGLVAVASDRGGWGLGLLLLGMIVFAAAPMRYGRSREAATRPPARPTPPPAPPPAPRERPTFEARDSREV